MRSPSRTAVGVICGIAALVVLSASSCSTHSPDIAVGKANRADVVELVDASAAVTAQAVATLTAAAEGTLTSMSVNAGQTVVPGQLLAVIDSPSARARLDSATRALDALGSGGGGFTGTDLSAAQRQTDAAAATAFAAARDAAAKIADPGLRTALLAQVAAAEQAYAQAAATARSLAAAVRSGLAELSQAMAGLTAAQRIQAQAGYDLAKSTVDALTLRAPIGGVVQLGGPAAGSSTGGLADLLGAASAAGGGVSALGTAGGGGGSGGGTSAGGGAPGGPGIDPAVPLGGTVSSGTPILTVVDTTELGLLAEVDETDVLLVTQGIPASVELDAAPGARYQGTVRSVDLLPGASTRGGVSYRVRLSLGAGGFADKRPAPVPRPGMSAVAHLAVRSAPDAVAVPAAAVFTVDGHDMVWLVRAGKAVRVPVTVGVTGQDLVQVASGLSAGDPIVVRGADRVHEGQFLR